MVKALDRKLLRDLRRSSGQVVAVAMVMAAGIAGFTGFYGTWRSLEASRDAYYAAYDFAHVFARLERAPWSAADRMAEIPGVARVETRLSAEALLDVASMSEPVPGRVHSLPGGRSPRLDQLHLASGRGPDPARPAEALVLRAFADSHGLRPGDVVSAIVDGKRLRLEIVGLVMSPEYVFSVGASGFSDDRHFGVLWLSEPVLAAARGVQGTFDDALLWLRPSANEAEVIAAVDRALAPYGEAGARSPARTSSRTSSWTARSSSSAAWPRECPSSSSASPPSCSTSRCRGSSPPRGSRSRP